ncbi:Hsp70 family protein [Dactylosporangium sp. NPDC051541]|uniref:Hsp70 family protein n=1 Tax=Dactylosporangium sp. NPDC051541 TaxID=3363977 RepID=UPI0037B8F213
MAYPLPAQPWLAIDYGTSNTVAMLAWPDGRVRPLLFDSSPLLPSAVCLDDDGRLLTGRAALRKARVAPQSFEPNPKRRVDDVELLLGERSLPVVRLIGATLGRVWQEATRTLSTPPTGVVITCPVEWGPARQSVLVDAAREAGLPAITLLPEPTAAATYFATVLGRELAPGGCVVVYDLGAGTFDVSVVRRGEHAFEPLAYRGLDDFGGLDLDEIVLSIVGDVMRRSAPDDWQRLRNPGTVAETRGFRTLWQDATEVKEALSAQASAALLVPLADQDVIVTREQFEERARPRLADTIRITTQCMRESRVAPEHLAAVFLVGGASRMPLVATMLHTATGIAPTVLDQPELVVAEGALRSVALLPPVSAPLPAAPISPVSPVVGLSSPPAGPVSAAPMSAPVTVMSPPGPFPPGPFPPQTTGPFGTYPGVPAEVSPPAPPPPPAGRPDEFGTRPAKPVARAIVLALLGLAAIILGMAVAFDIVHFDHYDYSKKTHEADEATVALMLISLPGALLVSWAIRTVAPLLRRGRLLIDETGLRLLSQDPIVELRWRAAAWWVSGLILVVVSASYVKYWMNGDGDGPYLLLPCAAGLLGALLGVVRQLRLRGRRRHWLDRWREANATDPSAAVEIDALRWPEIQTVAVQRVSIGRHQSLIAVPTDRTTLTGPAAAHRRTVLNGTAFVFADLAAVGLPPKAVRTALGRHSGGRFTITIGH